MFRAKTDRVEKLSQKYPERIAELEALFDKCSNLYIDYANVRPWADKLKWHIDCHRLRQFFASFDRVKCLKIFHGTLEGNQESETLIKDLAGWGFEVKTKPVKRMRLSIDVSSIPAASTDILKNFIRWPLLKSLKVESIEYLNRQLAELNKQGTRSIEDLKCNFDVEIGREMLRDYDKNGIENFALFSGDSDFADPVKQLLDDGKKVVLFATARRIAAELNDLQSAGLIIYDVQKIRNFICWKREIEP
jgi:uncharacterized LabA/DUF88 family protein